MNPNHGFGDIICFLYQEWNKTMHEEQEKTPLYEKPKLTVEEVARKIGELDREVKYLVNKAKTFRPKPKSPANKTQEDTKSKENDTKKATGIYTYIFCHTSFIPLRNLFIYLF